MKKLVRNETGSLALEHVLFIAAIVAISSGIFGFYDKLETFFSTVDIENAATNGTWEDSSTTSN